MSPAKKKAKITTTSPTFEKALEELEEMVETMESGQLPLEKLITSYERGAELINHCETVLSDARQRLELITLKPKAPREGEKNDLTKDEASASTNDNEDEIRLF